MYQPCCLGLGEFLCLFTFPPPHHSGQRFINCIDLEELVFDFSLFFCFSFQWFLLCFFVLSPCLRWIQFVFKQTFFSRTSLGLPAISSSRRSRDFHIPFFSQFLKVKVLRSLIGDHSTFHVQAFSTIDFSINTALAEALQKGPFLSCQ